MLSKEIQAALTEKEIPFSVNAAVQTTLLKAFAQLAIAPKSVDQIPDILAILEAFGLEHHVHGHGSKTLMLGTVDHPAKTPVIKTNHLAEVRVDTQNGLIHAQAGIPISKVSARATSLSLSGLEFATDIPGTTAGAVATDACHPLSGYEDLFAEQGIESSGLVQYLRDILVVACLVDVSGTQTVLNAQQLQMRDRSSILLHDPRWILTSATLQLFDDDPAQIKARQEIISAGRRRMRARNEEKNQASVGRTLGYTFVLNHPSYRGKSASQIIASTASLPHQIRRGDMIHCLSTPNIIANTGNGTAEEYLSIAEMIREAVLREHGLELPLEVRVVR